MRFHGRRHLVFVVDLDDPDLVALDAALAVQQIDVVVVARAKKDTNGLCRPGAIALQAEHEFLVLSVRRRGGKRQTADEAARPEPMSLACHRFLLRYLGFPHSIGKWPNPEVIANIAPQPI